MTTTDDKTTLLVDSHFHLHHISELEAVLQHANTQFKKATTNNNINTPWYGVLVLTDDAKSTGFSHIKYMISTAPERSLRRGNWELSNTDESSSVIAKNTSGQAIFICAGQHIVTREKLELLSILSDTRIPDGRPVYDTIKAVRQQGGLPVLSWSAGTWLGQKGKIVSNILEKATNEVIFIGDNSTRPKLWAVIPQFTVARQNNIPVLRGTYPLNIKNKKKLGGDFGFYVSGKFNPLKPAESLQAILTARDVEIKDYGKLNKLHHFIADQYAMRFSS